jgi:flagellar hook-basal body complex protein FliE
MIIPPLGGLAGQLSGAAAGAGPASAASAAASGSAAALGQELPAAGVSEGAGGGTPSFGNELTHAISSLESSQQSADSASQALATGNVKDPEAAIATVEDAALTMQLAAQIRTKATDAATTIFQTQV